MHQHSGLPGYLRAYPDDAPRHNDDPLVVPDRRRFDTIATSILAPGRSRWRRPIVLSPCRRQAMDLSFYRAGRAALFKLSEIQCSNSDQSTGGR
jgi:hypothetical protein